MCRDKMDDAIIAYIRRKSIICWLEKQLPSGIKKKSICFASAGYPGRILKN